MSVRGKIALPAKGVLQIREVNGDAWQNRQFDGENSGVWKERSDGKSPSLVTAHDRETAILPALQDLYGKAVA